MDAYDAETSGAEEAFDPGGFFLVEAEHQDPVVFAHAALVRLDELQETAFFVGGEDDFYPLRYRRVGAKSPGRVVPPDGDVNG